MDTKTIPSFHIGLKGQYKIEIKRNNTIIKETDWFDNLITDYGLLEYKKYRHIDSFECHIGTGTGTPSVSDTKLETRLKTSDTSNRSSLVEENKKAACIYEFTFPKGSVIGNITEVGVKYYYGSVLFSRSLITDSNNVLTALTITDIDELTVYYKILIKFPTEDTQPFTIVNNGVTHTVIGRRILKTKAIPHSWANLTSVLSEGDGEGILGYSSNFILSDNLNNSNDRLFKPIDSYNYNYDYIHNSDNGVSSVDQLTINPNLPELTSKIILKHAHCNWSTGIKYVAALNRMFKYFHPDGSNTGFLYYFEFDPPLVKTDEQELHITYKVTWGRE